MRMGRARTSTPGACPTTSKSWAAAGAAPGACPWAAHAVLSHSAAAILNAKVAFLTACSASSDDVCARQYVLNHIC